jgi:L-threonylcarbamoyladenylate synthase
MPKAFDKRIITSRSRNSFALMPKPQSWRYKMVATRLQQGAVIAYPTEGVWGLGCLPEDPEAVNRILSMKQRSWRQGLILVGASFEQVEGYIGHITEEQRSLLQQVWPGPVTFIVPRSEQVPDWIAGDSDRVAIRVSAHSVVQGVCSALGQPIVSTSANPGGKAPALSKLTVQRYFRGAIDLIVPGALGGQSGASEIRDLVTGAVIRAPSPKANP